MGNAHCFRLLHLGASLLRGSVPARARPSGGEAHSTCHDSLPVRGAWACMAPNIHSSRSVGRCLAARSGVPCRTRAFAPRLGEGQPRLPHRAAGSSTGVPVLFSVMCVLQLASAHLCTRRRFRRASEALCPHRPVRHIGRRCGRARGQTYEEPGAQCYDGDGNILEWTDARALRSRAYGEAGLRPP